MLRLPSVRSPRNARASSSLSTSAKVSSVIVVEKPLWWRWEGPRQ